MPSQGPVRTDKPGQCFGVSWPQGHCALYGSQAGTCVTDIQFGVGQHYPGDEVGRIALHCHAQL